MTFITVSGHTVFYGGLGNDVYHSKMEVTPSLNMNKEGNDTVLC